MILHEQKRRESRVMVLGLVSLFALVMKHFTDYDIPNEILDALVELLLSVYVAYSVGNSPRIRGEY